MSSKKDGLHYKKDGSLDMRYSSSKNFVASGGSKYGPSQSTSYSPSNYSNSRPSTNYSYSNSNSNYNYSNSNTNYGYSNSNTNYNTSNPQDLFQNIHSTFDTISTNNNSSLYTNNEIKINKDGGLNRNSKAVKSGAIRFNKDGTIDGRSSAVRQGKIILNKDRQIDTAAMGLSAQSKKPSSSTTNSSFSHSSFYDDGSIKYNKNGTINKNSKAVRNGELKFNKDGSVDKRSSAVKKNKVVLNSEGKVEAPNMNYDLEPGFQSYQHKYTAKEIFPLFTDEDIKLNLDGTVNKNSRAVKNGSIKFKNDGSIDKRCIAYKQNRIILNSEDQIDYLKMDLLLPAQKQTKQTENNYSYIYKYKDPFESVEEYKPIQPRSLTYDDLIPTNYNNSNNYNNDIDDDIDDEQNYTEREVKIEYNDDDCNNKYEIQEEEEQEETPVEEDKQYKYEEEKTPKVALNNDIQYTKQLPLFDDIEDKREELKPKTIKKEIIRNNKPTSSNYENYEQKRKSTRNEHLNYQDDDDDDEREEDEKPKRDKKLNKTTSNLAKNMKKSKRNNHTSYQEDEYDKSEEEEFEQITRKNTKNKMKTQKTRSTPIRYEKVVKKYHKESISQRRKKKSKQIIKSIIFLTAFLITYFYILSFIPLPKEKYYLTKCPKNAICDIKQERNETIYTINHCIENYVKIENDFIQICSPDYQPTLEEYKETLRASSYISKKNGDCLFNHEKFDEHYLSSIFPKAVASLLEKDEDFFVVFVNEEFKSALPQYNSACRIYQNSFHYMFTQTIMIVVFSLIIFVFGIITILNKHY